MKNSYQYKCGIVSITGLPNAGKSTLINRIINEKISIVSNKVQTTRNALRAIYVEDKCQIIFVDTPGILKPKSFLNKEMTRAIYRTSEDSDINLYIHDVKNKILKKKNSTLETLLNNHKKNFLILNKIDTTKKESLLIVSERLNNCFKFEKTFMISALKNKGISELISCLKKEIPVGNWQYINNEKTDKNLNFILSEITREKIFQLTNKEIPYAVNINTKKIRKINHFKIFQEIIIKKESQKPILIGKKGEKIKEIGMRARIEMEKKIREKIYLNLMVKVKK